ncbi:MAG: hypothetical protein IKI93_14305 [Clostridia bacterium]|nr:hypothetical protein [Clostridia bacterium]
MNYNYQPYQPMYGQGYGQPMQDQLSQLRQPYQPMQMQPMPQGQPMMPVQQTQPDNGMIWVQGEAGAKAYMVAPGNSVVLWDSEDHVIYIKSADAAGMPGMRVFEYIERTAAPRNVSVGSTNQYVTRAEFEDFAARINQMMQPMTGGGEANNAE